MILLHTTKYGDSSIILHGFTREQGRKSFIIRGVGKKKGSSSTALLHPLSILETELRPGADYSIAQLKDYSAKYPLHSLRSNVIKNTIAIYMSELLYRTLRDSEGDPALYDFIEKAILTLNSLEGSTPNFHIWFTIKYISMLGFMPDSSSLFAFDIFTPQERELLTRFLTSGIEELLLLPLKRETRNEFIGTLVKFLEQSLGQRIEIKSLNVLHQVLV
jgi:DNA repair protein RecO (recombination protein O)